MNELALFAGAGGGILGGVLLGWRTVAAVEIEEYPRSILLQRQADKVLPRFPVWDDIRTFDGKPWRGKVDIITGGFPCQDISAAGRGAGITGERSGLWSEMARVVSEIRPPFCFVENSPLLVSRGLDVVLSDLASMGYDAEWGIVGAHHAGAPHKRDRVWILAYAESRENYRRKGRIVEEKARVRGCVHTTINACSQVIWWHTDPADMGDSDLQGYKAGMQSGDAGETSGQENMADADKRGLQKPRTKQQAGRFRQDDENTDAGEIWPTESRLGRVAHGVAHRVDRLKAIGNGQVPAVAALAWHVLMESINAHSDNA